MNDRITISRRDFTKMWAMIAALFTAVQAKGKDPTDNTSFWQHRIGEHVPEDWKYIEKALADQWEYENRPGAWNHEDGLLSALMDGTRRSENPPELAGGEITPRERKIVATVIQWLGTNCGRSFLYEASRRMGAAQYPFERAMNYARGKRLKRESPELWARLQKLEGKSAYLGI